MRTRNETRGKCANQQDLFCYICGEYTKKEQKIDISDKIWSLSSLLWS